MLEGARVAVHDVAKERARERCNDSTVSDRVHKNVLDNFDEGRRGAVDGHVGVLVGRVGVI